MSEPVKPRRAYNSERRREAALQTRRRIVEAATARFIEHGFAGTTIAAVAADASTAAETVYAAFRTKDALLAEVVGAAARGGDDRAIREQDGPKLVAAARTHAEQLELFAHDIADRLSRTAPLVRVVAGAVPTSPELAMLYAEIHERRLRALRVVPEMLEARGALRLGADEATESIWALASPELYQLCTVEGGWSHERYASWLARSLCALLIEP